MCNLMSVVCYPAHVVAHHHTEQMDGWMSEMLIRGGGGGSMSKGIGELKGKGPPKRRVDISGFAHLIWPVFRRLLPRSGGGTRNQAA